MKKGVINTAKSPIARYRRYLQLEKSMTENTLMAYIGDIQKFEKFLSDAQK